MDLDDYFDSMLENRGKISLASPFLYSGGLYALNQSYNWMTDSQLQFDPCVFACISIPLSITTYSALSITNKIRKWYLSRKYKQIALKLIRKGHINLAYFLAKPSTLENNDINSKLLLAYHQSNFVKRFRDQEKANQLWGDFVENLPSQGYILEEITGNRNQIFKIPSEEIKDIIIIKRAKDLKKEYLLLDYLDEQFEDKNPCVRLLGYYSVNGIDTLVTALKRDNGLEQLLSGETPIEKIQTEAELSVQSLAQLHSLPIPSLQLSKYSPPDQLIIRLVNRLGNNIKSGALLRAYMNECGNRYFPADTLAHGDFSIQNTFEGGSFLDLESVTIDSPSLDLETFFAAIQLKDIDQEQAFKIYLKTREEIEERNLIIHNRDFYAFHCAMCYIGTYFNRNDEKRFKHSFERAVEKIEDIGALKLRDSLLAYVEASPAKHLM